MNLNEEQSLIKGMAHQFAQCELAPQAAQWDRTTVFPQAAIAAMGELGFMGMLVPHCWQGSGCDYLSYVLAVEEIAAGDGACSTIMSVHNSVVCLPLLHAGSTAQKEHWLKPLAKGEKLGCFCLSEPQAGSDAANIMTHAEQRGDQYVLNGIKQFVTSGQSADVAIVFATLTPDMPKQGITAFIVPTDSVGYEVATLEKKCGQRASDTAQIVLNQVKVPLTNRLGAVGEGYKIALAHLETGRLGVAAQAIGMARAALKAATDYAQQRSAFGKLLAQHQAVAFRLSDMATQLEAARQLLHYAARLLDNQQPARQAAAMAKLFASEMAEKVCSDAMQIHGGYGYLNDFPLERIYRDVRVTQIYEGTSDIQRMVISRCLLRQ